MLDLLKYLVKVDDVDLIWVVKNIALNMNKLDKIIFMFMNQSTTTTTTTTIRINLNRSKRNKKKQYLFIYSQEWDIYKEF